MLLCLRKLLRASVVALALAHLALSSSPTVHARMVPWTLSMRSAMHNHAWTHESAASPADDLDTYIREGRFPQAGRSLEQKIREANAFLDRELTNAANAGVGSSVAIVYQDQVVLSKGYGLRVANDSASSVGTSTLFQIGSVTKTFITLGIAILVDEGKVAWRDPVIKHLPTFELFDKYAEKYVTIGDMLAMNSGLGATLDLAWVFGKYQTDKELVAALRNAEPSHSLRSEYEYANSNFAILGQLIESVTGIEWDAFLKQRIWEPLGMNRTFSSAFEAKDDNDISSGHMSCGGEVLGPFNLVTSPEAQLVTGQAGGKMAAGSVVSSSDDMAKLMRVLLNKGSVENAKLLKSPKLVTEMVSGKSVVNAEFVDMFNKGGHHFVPEGNTLAAGYGFDFVSHGLWGHAYFDKSGDTALHQTRTGFAPDQQLGVIVMANSQLPTPHGNYIMDHVRSYIMGIFLDVPADILDFSFAKWRKDDALQSPLPGLVPVCGLSFWKNPPILDLDPKEADALVGVYLPLLSSDFFGSIEIAKTGDNQLEFRAGKLSGVLSYVVDLGTEGKALMWGEGPSTVLIQVSKNANGKYEVNLGIPFVQHLSFAKVRNATHPKLQTTTTAMAWRRSGSALSRRLALSEEVAEALYGQQKRPVVALESTIISHGMPFPQNVEMAKTVEDLVRAQGACPATICIADGELKVGLSDADLHRLAELGSAARKCSTRDIAAAVTENIVGATTVSSTMRIAHAAGIKVFVTGGIGGVHRFCEETMDVSTDLMELSRTPVAVICAGIKSILDIPRTLEYLETHSVPVVGYKTNQFPAFFTQDSGVKAHLRRDTPHDVAALIHESRALELPNGFVVAVPNPNPVPSDVIDRAIELGLKEVVEKNIKGQAVTPYLLKRLNEITQGVSLGSNIDLVKNNATVGSQIAQALFEIESDRSGLGSVGYSIASDSQRGAVTGTKENAKRVLVVGGLVLDIISSSSSPIIRATSNIGAIHQSSGGVGRNIAECLLRLDMDPLLISSVGNDASGSILLENLKKLGMDASGIQVSDEVATAVYSAVLCSAGDLDVAIADMRALDTIDTSAIPDAAIRDSGLVICDANLSPEALRILLKRSSSLGVDVWFEPTSVQKAVRVVDADAVQHLTYVSPNGDELQAMSEAIQRKSGATTAPHERFKLSDESHILPNDKMHQLKNDIITVLLEMASGNTTKEKHVIVTLGKHGVLVGSVNMDPVALHALAESASEFPIEIWGTHQVHGGHQVAMVHLPGVEIQVKNCTGAGDSLVGGTVYGLSSGRNIFESCHLGMVAARASLVSECAINPALSPQVLQSAQLK